MDPDINLKKAKLKICQREAVGEQKLELKGKGAALEATEVAVVHLRPHRSHRDRYTQWTTPISKTTPTSKKTCKRCGKQLHPLSKCLAKEVVCHKCSKRGHYSSQCLTKLVLEVREDNVLDNIAGKETTAWFRIIAVNGCNIKFKLDTGAEVTAISEQEYKNLNQSLLQKRSFMDHLGNP